MKTYWHGSHIRFRRSVPDAVGEPVMLTTSDRADVRGIWWTSRTNPKPRVAVIASHPRADFSFHHTFPDFRTRATAASAPTCARSTTTSTASTSTS
ncbi:MAG: hypothetical protein M5U09_30325 [Gammaproteobacteria bacterium]|nr:hypothetical protein [Gammaproteobacteria bacterium]